MPEERAAGVEQSTVSLDRCKALGDGVIAIAMTLLVFGIDVSGSEERSGESLVALLRDLGPSLLVYVASFWVLGTYWVLHSAILDCFRRSDRTLIWLNLLFLLPVTFIPFVSQAKEVYRHSEVAVVLLCVTNILVGVCLLLLWRHGTSNPHLLRFEVDDATRRRANRRIVISPIALSAVGLAASWLSVYLTSACILLIPLYHLSQRRLVAEELMASAGGRG